MIYILAILELCTMQTGHCQQKKGFISHRANYLDNQVVASIAFIIGVRFMNTTNISARTVQCTERPSGMNR